MMLEEKKFLENRLHPLKRGWLFILIATLVSAYGTFYVASEYLPPTYQATAHMLVTQESEVPLDENGEATVAAANQQDYGMLITTYQDIILTPEVIESVAKKLGVSDLSVNKLDERAFVKSTPGSQVIALNVKANSPEVAQREANTMAEAFKEYLPEVMSSSGVEVFSPARIPLKPVGPNIPVLSVLGAMMGLVLSLMLVYVFYFIKGRRARGRRVTQDNSKWKIVSTRSSSL